MLSPCAGILPAVAGVLFRAGNAGLAALTALAGRDSTALPWLADRLLGGLGAGPVSVTGTSHQ